MVGNDIIDIELARQQSNWKRLRYLDKICTVKEQNLIECSEEPDIMVWRLWSMKEAAYKLYTQLYPSRFYNPKGFECSLEDGGVVRYRAFICYVKTRMTSRYMVSEASIERRHTTSKVIELNATSPRAQSRVLRDKALSFVSQQLHCDKNDLRFVKHKYGIPTIQYNTKDFNISLSHHGQFGAIAFAP
ncbi:MAG: 4'-phosphopantetheinyl transferase superfamily protein [Bacteroidota bacterium]